MGNETSTSKEKEQPGPDSGGQDKHEGAAPYPGEGAVKWMKGKLFGGGKGASTEAPTGADSGDKGKEKEADKTAADPSKSATVDPTATTATEEAPKKDEEPKTSEPVSAPTPAPEGGSAPKTEEAEAGPAPTVPTLAESIGAAVKGRSLADALKLVAADPAMGLAALGGNKSAFMTLIRDTRPHTTPMRAQITSLYNAADFVTKQEIFAARFKVTLTSAGAQKFTEAELDTIHAQSILLPPGHVEGLGSYVELKRDVTNASAEGSANGTNIMMSDQKDATRYSQVFRHEVGHAVDTALGGECESFRTAQAGWTRYAGLDDFIAAAGGWGTVPDNKREVVKTALDAFLKGGGPWNSPGKFDDALLVAVKAKHPGVTEAPDKSDDVSKDMAALQALYGSNAILDTARGSEGTFYFPAAQAKWPQASGKSFFFNFYYHVPFSVAASTHNDLKTWNNAAAGFSDKEWFAEVYAAWYSTPVPGAARAFPGFVTAFMNSKVAKVGGPDKAPGPESGNPKAKG